MITSADLKNRVTGAEPTGTDAVQEDLRRVKGRGLKPEPTDDPELAARIVVAKGLLPQGNDLHCADCWTRGRDAAIRTIEGGKEGQR